MYWLYHVCHKWEQTMSSFLLPKRVKSVGNIWLETDNIHVYLRYVCNFKLFAMSYTKKKRKKEENEESLRWCTPKFQAPKMCSYIVSCVECCGLPALAVYVSENCLNVRICICLFCLALVAWYGKTMQTTVCLLVSNDGMKTTETVN